MMEERGIECTKETENKIFMEETEDREMNGRKRKTGGWMKGTEDRGIDGRKGRQIDKWMRRKIRDG